MIINRPIAWAVDEAHDRYVVNLQISWPANISPIGGPVVPNMFQLLANGSKQPMFPPAYRDDFDMRSILGNIVLPRIESIVGSVVWSLNGVGEQPGFFHIFEGGSGVMYSFRPRRVTNVPGINWMAACWFALPMVTPVGSFFSFYRTQGTTGFYAGCANLALLTWPVPYFYRSN